MGRYDMVVIVDAPDSETVAKILLTTTSGVAVGSETLPAFTGTGYRKVISELP